MGLDAQSTISQQDSFSFNCSRLFGQTTRFLRGIDCILPVILNKRLYIWYHKKNHTYTYIHVTLQYTYETPAMEQLVERSPRTHKVACTNLDSNNHKIPTVSLSNARQ